MSHVFATKIWPLPSSADARPTLGRRCAPHCLLPQGPAATVRTELGGDCQCTSPATVCTERPTGVLTAYQGGSREVGQRRNAEGEPPPSAAAQLFSKRGGVLLRIFLIRERSCSLSRAEKAVSEGMLRGATARPSHHLGRTGGSDQLLGQTGSRPPPYSATQLAAP